MSLSRTASSLPPLSSLLSFSGLSSESNPDLPHFVVSLIFTYLPKQDMTRLKRVNKLWLQVSEEVNKEWIDIFAFPLVNSLVDVPCVVEKLTFFDCFKSMFFYSNISLEKKRRKK